MKPRYVVINEQDREVFEKQWQIPYGYGEHEIFTDFEDAIDELETYYNSREFIIEKIDTSGREIVYRGGLEKA